MSPNYAPAFYASFHFLSWHHNDCPWSSYQGSLPPLTVISLLILCLKPNKGCLPAIPINSAQVHVPWSWPLLLFSLGLYSLPLVSPLPLLQSQLALFKHKCNMSCLCLNCNFGSWRPFQILYQSPVNLNSILTKENPLLCLSSSQTFQSWDRPPYTLKN